MIGYMDMYCKGSSNVIFEGTDLLSASRLMGLPQLTKTKTGSFDEAVNMMMGYSLDHQIPAYYRLLPGNIKDVKAFRVCMNESGAPLPWRYWTKPFPRKTIWSFSNRAA